MVETKFDLTPEISDYRHFVLVDTKWMIRNNHFVFTDVAQFGLNVLFFPVTT